MLDPLHSLERISQALGYGKASRRRRGYATKRGLVKKTEGENGETLRVVHTNTGIKDFSHALFVTQAGRN